MMGIVSFTHGGWMVVGSSHFKPVCSCYYINAVTVQQIATVPARYYSAREKTCSFETTSRKNLNIFECSNNFKVPSNKMIGWTKCFNKCSTKSSNQPYVPYETDSKNAKVRWRAYHEIHWVRELIWRTRCDIAYTCYSLRSFLYDTVDFFLQLWPTLFN